MRYLVQEKLVVLLRYLQMSAWRMLPLPPPTPIARSQFGSTDIASDRPSARAPPSQAITWVVTMLRRAFIAALGSVATCGAGAAGRAASADRRAHGFGRGRSGETSPP